MLETKLLGFAQARDRAIRQKREEKLVGDMKKLKVRASRAKLKRPEKTGETMGKLRERYPWAARYRNVEYDPKAGQAHRRGMSKPAGCGNR